MDRDAGGAVSLSSPSDVLRDRQQAYNIFRHIDGKIKSRDTGPSKYMHIDKLVVLMSRNTFLKDVSLAWKKESVCPITFAMTDQAKTWIQHHCSPTSNKARSQVQIDMTYKVGLFYVTLMSLGHPMFCLKNDRKKHPTLLLGMMTSTTRDTDNYQYLATKLKSSGVKTLIYGTDGELALWI